MFYFVNHKDQQAKEIVCWRNMQAYSRSSQDIWTLFVVHAGQTKIKLLS